MAWIRWFTLPIALACSACTGTPVESATGSADGDDADDDDDDDDDDDGTTDPSATDPTADPTTDPTTDATAETTSASTDPDTGETSSDDGSDPTTAGDTSGTTTGGADCHPQLNEVAFNLMGDDNGLEWIAIFNPCEDPIELAGYALGWGGTDYTYATLQLAGSIAAQGCFVVGGPTVSQTNYSPELDQSVDLHEDLQNPSSATADGIALFVGDAMDIEPTTVPVDAVVYGTDNVNDLIDESGSRSALDVEPVNDMQTIARVPGGGWVLNGSPTPNDCSDPAA